MDAPAAKPRPVVNALTAPFWEGTRARRLLVQQCRRCGHRQWTPQLACQSCLTETCDWVPCRGRGTVYSYSVVHRPVDARAWPADEVPYVVAIVCLDEGVHLLTNIVGCPPSEVRIGMPVVVDFVDVDDEITLYPFRPAPTEDGVDGGS